jgi:hypothetical protein
LLAHDDKVHSIIIQKTSAAPYNKATHTFLMQLYSEYNPFTKQLPAVFLTDRPSQRADPRLSS